MKKPRSYRWLAVVSNRTVKSRVTVSVALPHTSPPTGVAATTVVTTSPDVQELRLVGQSAPGIVRGTTASGGGGFAHTASMNAHVAARFDWLPRACRRNSEPSELSGSTYHVDAIFPAGSAVTVQVSWPAPPSMAPLVWVTCRVTGSPARKPPPVMFA